jgi:DNA repair exonuclease SbcCD ATPase subunit
MLANNTKILERYISQGNHEQIAIWQEKVDKLRAQLGEGPDPGHGHDNRGSSYASQPAQHASQQHASQQFQNQYSSQPVTAPTHYSTPSPAQPTYNQPPPQQAYQQPSYSQDPIQKMEQEMQELRQANARLREQLAQKEEVNSRESRMHTLEAGDMNGRIQELMATQLKFDGLLSEKQSKIDLILREQTESERRNTELMAQQTVRDSQTLREKEAELESKVKGISQANNHLQQLNADLVSQQESANTHVRILADEKDRLQESVDLSRSQVLAKQQEIEQVQKTLAAIAREQEEEAAKLGEFVSKSISAIKLATESSSHSNMANIVVKSTSNVGFGSLTIKTIVEK